jgi:hypothetical protein
MRGTAARALLPALLLLALTGGPVAAAGVGGASWTPATARAVLTVSGFRTFRDSVYVFVWLSWDRRTLRALRSYGADGLRYTQEVNDLSGWLSATGAWTSDLPGASYDRDDDDGDGRWEEVEITATDVDAIEAGRTYLVGFQLSRWWRACEDDSCPWRWSHRGGTIGVLSQLSRDFLGEWQAIRWTNPWALLRYPRMRRPGAEAGGASDGSMPMPPLPGRTAGQRSAGP